MAVSSIGPLKPLDPPAKLFQTGETRNAANQEDSPAVSFAAYLKNSLDGVNDLQINAEEVANDFAAGKIDNIADVTTAAEKADIALQLTIQIRNKILDAYNEIMRMQI